MRRHWAGGWRGAATVLAVGIVCILPGINSLPPIDRDEARFAEATRQMVIKREWSAYIVPMIQDRPRLKKPPLIHWLQAACVVATDAHPAPPYAGLPSEELLANRAAEPNWQSFNGAIAAYRIPSAIGALLAGMLTWLLARRMFAAPAAAWSGVLLVSSLVVLVDARQARVDQVLLALTTLAQLALWQVWSTRSRSHRPWPWPLVLWLAVGLGIMTKGPVTPAVVGLTALALSAVTREWRWLTRLCPLFGVAVVTAVVAPWIVLVVQAVGWETFSQTVIDEVVGRSMEAQEGHWGPPGYYIVLLPLLFWPGSLVLFPAFARARRAFRWVPAPGDATHRGAARRLIAHWRRLRAGRSAELFCLCWLVPGWLAFELVATKLPHYTLPMFPALALLAGRALAAGAARPMRAPSHAAPAWSLAVWWVLTGLLTIATPALLLLFGNPEMPVGAYGAVAAVMVAALALWIGSGRMLKRGRLARAATGGVALAAGLSLAVFFIVLPNARAFWVSPRLASELYDLDPAGQRPLATAGYHEDSLIFLTAGRVERISWLELRAWLDEFPDGLAIAPDNDDFLERSKVNVLARLAGFNYSSGDPVALAVVEDAGRSAAAR